MTIKKSLQEFKRTHQDNWQVSSFLFHILKNLFFYRLVHLIYLQEHKTKFTEDQLVVMTDLLVSQNYYA